MKKYNEDIDHNGRSKIVGDRLKVACENNKPLFFIMSQDDEKIEDLRKKVKERNKEY